MTSRPCQTLLGFPKSSSGISTPLETEVAHGSFTPTSAAFPCLTNLITSNYPAFTFGGYSRRRRLSLYCAERHAETGSDTSSVPASPTSLFDSSPSIPGITRTSSYDTHSSTSSTLSLLDEPLHRIRAKSSEMNPILLELERKSKLCKLIAGCATCGKHGSDYPRCGRCGEMWCSRPCRLRGGKKHICVTQTS